MLCSLAFASLMPTYADPEHRPGPLWHAQMRVSAIFWSCWIGVAVGLIVDLILTPPRIPSRPQFSVRSLFLFTALIASALGGYMLYAQIMAMPR